jgi:hypothetical protein
MWCYSKNYNFPTLNSESVQNLSLNTSWTVPFGEATQPAFHAPVIILDITGVTDTIKDYYGQIHDPLKKWVQIQVELTRDMNPF